jgi:hypothetical protein
LQQQPPAEQAEIVVGRHGFPFRDRAKVLRPGRGETIAAVFPARRAPVTVLLHSSVLGGASGPTGVSPALCHIIAQTC